jgi:hypothetical protein
MTLTIAGPVLDPSTPIFWDGPVVANKNKKNKKYSRLYLADKEYLCDPGAGSDRITCGSSHPANKVEQSILCFEISFFFKLFK